MGSICKKTLATEQNIEICQESVPTVSDFRSQQLISGSHLNELNSNIVRPVDVQEIVMIVITPKTDEHKSQVIQKICAIPSGEASIGFIMKKVGDGSGYCLNRKPSCLRNSNSPQTSARKRVQFNTKASKANYKKKALPK